MFSEIIKKALKHTSRHKNAPNSGGKKWTGELFQGVDALRKRRDITGQAMRFPAGETIFLDNTGGLTVRDRQGRIVKTISRNESEIQFEYDSDRMPVTALLPSGQRIEKGQFKILNDGTLRLPVTTASGVISYRDFRLDGTVCLVNEKGRLTHLRVDIETQKAKFYAILDNLMRERIIKGEQHQHICDTMHALMRRIALDEITETEAAQTVYHINRLMESCGHSALTAQVCFMLAHELMFFSAFPDYTDKRDGLSALIGQLFRKCPSQAAMLVADMSLYRRYVTGCGITVNYIEELMSPLSRKQQEWTCSTDRPGKFLESNKFLRVVLVNVAEKLRITKRANKENLALLDEHRRSFSTKQFGKVFDRELTDLFQAVTGRPAQGVAFLFQTAAEEELPRLGTNKRTCSA